MTLFSPIVTVNVGTQASELPFRFMEMEFERLDKDKRWELDVKELTQFRLRVAQLAHAAPHR